MNEVILFRLNLNSVGAPGHPAATYFKFSTVIYGHSNCSYITVANVE